MAAVPFKVKAVFEYSSPHDDDLSFPNGQVITVTEEEDADWYVGEYTDSSGGQHSGLFPKNFVEKYEPEIPSRPTRPTRPKSEVVSPPQSAITREQPQEDVPALPTQDKPIAAPLAAAHPVQDQEGQSARGSTNDVEPATLTAGTTASSTKSALSSGTKAAPPPVSEKPS